MKNEAIGIFDSGVGGLTVMKQIVCLLPNEDIVYFGDTARLPYGEKSPETIIRYMIENSTFLLKHKIKVLVIACNTASAHALHELKNRLQIPVIEVIAPGAEKAVLVTKNKRIAVLGTRGTINSGAYQKEIERRMPGSFVLSIPCPLLVPLVEENFIDHPVTKMIIKEYLKPIKEQSIDTVLLGCTHYPLLKEVMQDELGHEISIVDSASICAENLQSILCENKLLSSKIKSVHRYFVSDDPMKFSSLGGTFFGRPIENVKNQSDCTA